MCESRPSRTYCRARDKEDLQERIKAFELVPLLLIAIIQAITANHLLKELETFIIKLKLNEATVISS